MRALVALARGRGRGFSDSPRAVGDDGFADHGLAVHQQCDELHDHVWTAQMMDKLSESLPQNRRAVLHDGIHIVESGIHILLDNGFGNGG